MSVATEHAAAAWADWRAAEQQLTGGGNLDAAAGALPERQAWILRALVALERGDREALEALGETVRDRTLDAVAEVALSDPGDMDPTRFRAYLKHRRVPNEPLPRLDLLRLTCVAHNREKPNRPPKLAAAADDRNVLDAALMVLSNRFKLYRVEQRLLLRSPRMASFWAAGIGQVLGERDVREFVRNDRMGVEPLPQEGWPDLDEPIGVGPPRGGSVSLDMFLSEPLLQPWSELCSEHAKLLETCGDRAQLHAAIGGLLDAIRALLRAGTPLAALPAVNAVVALASAAPELRQRGVLLNQLHLLEMRLLWSSPSLPEGYLEPLWCGVRWFPDKERAHCARALLDREDLPPLPRSIATEVLAAAIRSAVDWEQEGLQWLLKHGSKIDPRAFQAALADAPAEVREPALGLMHALHGSTVEALRLAAQFLERGERSLAEQIAFSSFDRTLRAPARGRQEARLRHRALLELARAASASSPPPDPYFLVAMLFQARADTEAKREHELLEALRPSFESRLALPPEPEGRDLLGRLQLMTMLDLNDKAQTEFREFGRTLRRGRPAETIPAALTICAGMCPDSETVLSYELDDEAPPARADGDPRPAWLHSLTTWLDRQPSEDVARHALALARSDRADAEGLLTWFDEVSELEQVDAWEELLMLAVPTGLGGFEGFDGFDGFPDEVSRELR